MLSRKRVAELMDDPQLAEEAHIEALTSLSRLNAVSLSAPLLWRELRPLLPAAGQEQLSILDIATGGGDLPRALYRHALRENVTLDICATDKSDTALRYASARAADAKIKFTRLDALSEPFPEGYDVVMCSLFVHHLDPEEAVLLFSKMRQAARRLVVVNDLVRSQWAYAIVWLGTRLLSRSAIVQFDGPVSVQAAYTTQEMRSMAIQAGMTNCAVKFCLPCRQVMTWTA